ncbi:MAG: efflux RND transporter periplasmic adaptor subunit [Methylocystaceae bacterium]|nr:MAG: efflux RND transporter periplasmic adaptor subunit [Methylocystaceae bacterium]
MSESLQRRARELAPSSGASATKTAPTRLKRTPFFIAALLFAGVLALGVTRHVERDQDAAVFQQTRANAVLHVRAAKVVKQAGPAPLELPGQTLAIEQARLFARATGYIAERRADIGTKIKKGDLLARIAAPELDQQYAQAQAQLALSKAQLSQSKAQVEQARANVNLAKATYARTATLVKQNYESKQNNDNAAANVETQTANLSAAQAGVEVAQANVAAQQATVDRLKQLTEFEAVTAPFKGVVTARNIDVGDLVSADANGGTPLFSVARDDVLRVQVAVPQSEAVGLADGLEAGIVIPETPGKTFKGRIARNASALDPVTRTLLVEVDVPNPTGELRPGLFVRVVLEVPRARPLVSVPAQSILFGAEGAQVATIDDGDVIRMKKIVIARDFGTTVDVEQGLSGDETIALDPPADIRDGRKVSIRN